MTLKTLTKLSIKMVLFLIFGYLLLFTFPNPKETIRADETTKCNPQVTDSRATGLISARSIANDTFSNPGGNCIISTQAALPMPTYEQLKSLYYSNTKKLPGVLTKNVPDTTPGDLDQDKIKLNGGRDQLYYIQNGNLVLSAFPKGNRSGVVFVDHELEVTGDLKNTEDSALVLIVKGKVSINETVKQIDAVIISSNTIYTATTKGSSCDTSSVQVNDPLVVNGSLIALGPQIRFCRDLNDNSEPAEVINQVPGYLPILRNILSTDTTERVEDELVGSYQNVYATAPPVF